MTTVTSFSYFIDAVVGIVGVAGIFGGRSRFLQTRADTTIKYLSQENTTLTTLNNQLTKDRVEDRKRILALEKQVAELQGMVRQTPEITSLTKLVTKNHVEMMGTITDLLQAIAGREENDEAPARVTKSTR